MSGAWIIVCLVIIAALYALLFATADALQAADRRRGSAVATPRNENGPKNSRHRIKRFLT